MTAVNDELALTDTQLHRLKRQVMHWREDLLNLDRRQRLVYFTHTRSASLEIIDTDPAAALKSLVKGTMLRAAEADVIDDDPDDAVGLPMMGDGLVVGDKTPSKLRAACRRLDQLSNQVYADRGFWTLYAGIGMLQWIDQDDQATVNSPILLCPVRLRRNGAQAPYRVERTEDEIVLNPALRLKLEKDFGITLADVDPDSIDVWDVLDNVLDKVRGTAGWDVHHRVVLTTFSFHKEAIYRDLMDHESAVLAHPMVQMIALGGDAPSAGNYSFSAIDDNELDGVVVPEDMMSILDADSSQRQCIIAARDGRSFVVDGPPGTGKSQTIANVICELMAIGKTVLFVSEKAAALDVVRNRLAEVGLGDFLLELHSHAATRKEVVGQLARALTQRASLKGRMPEAERQSLKVVRERLSNFAGAMNEIRTPIHRSLYEVLGRMMEIREHDGGPVSAPDDWAKLSAVRLDQLLECAARLARAWRPVSEGRDFLWRDLVNTRPNPADVERMRSASDLAADSAQALLRRVRAVDESVALTLPQSLPAVETRARLLELLDANPSAPVSWLHRAELNSLRECIALRRQAAESYLAAKDALTVIVGAAWQEVEPDLLPTARTLLDDQPKPLNVWKPTVMMTVSDVAGLLAFQASAPVVLESIATDVRQLGAILGVRSEDISFDRTLQLAELAALGGQPARPEREWLNPAVQSALDESSRILAELVDVVNQRRAVIERIFTPAALELDLAGLNVRFAQTHVGLRKFSKSARTDRKLLRSATVAGKVDKGVLAQLDEAVAWQQAERRLMRDEETHAPRLGRYYRRTDTDFGRLSEAISTAHLAVQLAAGDLNSGPMAEQLTADGAPDPQLMVVAGRLKQAGRIWVEQLRSHVGAEAAAAICQLPLGLIAESAVVAKQRAEAGHAAVASVAELAGRDLTVGTAINALEQAGVVAERSAELLNTFDDDRADLGELYDGAQSDWHALSAALEWADQVRRLVGGPVSELSAERMTNPTITAAELAEPIARWKDTAAALTSVFQQQYGDELRSELERDVNEAPDVLIEMTASAYEDIAEWTAYLAAVNELEEAGLGETVWALHERRSEGTAVQPTIEYALLQAWVETTMASDSRLAEFRATERDALVARFRDLDKQLVQSAHVAVADACNRRRPKMVGGAAANVIQREAQKKGRHLPIRELLSRAEDIVQELKPCFMMSPLSVSQFLPGSFTFDVVIFDEASQVLPSDAVNCIYRSRQLVVAGDEKQLPPTAFFTQAVDESEDDEGLDDFESVLKLCKTSFASLPLTWHYRSQHESLIAYSNYRFYTPDDAPLRSGNLQTFPGARFDAPDLGIESFIANGVYRRGSARDNPIEAEVVVDRILHHRRNHPALSIGVVTFSSAQEDAITSALDQRSVAEPLLRGLLDSHDRLTGFFVKNLENVQGDERDIIVFSVGYGPDENGKFTMNFGPLNSKGGWRRLNVAITRARMRVEVVSSFRAAQMHETSSDGVRHLRGYLDFAERGLPALALSIDNTGGDVESPFEADVLSVIRSWGYDVTPQVGTAGYRIDLGVRHPDKPGEFILGVECDGAAYHSAKAARDRDRLRTSVLEGLGWRMHRIWGISWYRDRAGQMNRLQRAIEDSVAGVGPTKEPTQAAMPVEMEPIDLDQAPDWAVTYAPYSGTAPYTYYELGSVEAREPLRTYLTDLLRHEAPIHQDLVNKRIRAAFQVGRIGPVIRDNIEFVARRLRVDGKSVKVDTAGFYRIDGLPAASVRVPADTDDIRPVQMVPFDELDLAVVSTVADVVGAGDVDIMASIRRIFGWRRNGGEIAAAVHASIDRCLDAGSIERSSSGAVRVRAQKG